MLRRTQSTLWCRYGTRSGEGRRLWAIVAVLGLLAQTWMPFFHHPPRAGVTAWLAGAICHVGGSGGAGRPSDPAKTGSHKAPFCPVCFALQLGGAFLLPTLGVLVTARMALSLAGRKPVSARLVVLCRTLAQPRGPPLPA
jgi:hypothetical protein